MRKAIIAAIIFFACAELAFATIGRSMLAGVRGPVILTIAIGVAAVTFIALAATEARRAGPRWGPATLKVPVGAAVAAAFAHALTYGVRVEFGHACNQCQPLVIMLLYPAVAALIAAACASLVGVIARRV